MKIEYEDYLIDIFDDPEYSMLSTDNVRRYIFAYNEGEIIQERIPYPGCQHGIVVSDRYTEEVVSSAIICEQGGATRIHPKSFFVEDQQIWLCATNKIYCLALPDLKVKWFKQVDDATNFGLYPFKEDFIIHGELGIFRITKAGKMKWRFGGRDIFVSQK